MSQRYVVTCVKCRKKTVTKKRPGDAYYCNYCNSLIPVPEDAETLA